MFDFILLEGFTADLAMTTRRMPPKADPERPPQSEAGEQKGDRSAAGAPRKAFPPQRANETLQKPECVADGECPEHPEAGAREHVAAPHKEHDDDACSIETPVSSVI